MSSSLKQLCLGSLLIACSMNALPASAQKTTSGKNPPVDLLTVRGRRQPQVAGIVQSEQVPAGFPVAVYSNNVISTYFSQTTSKSTPVTNGTITTRDPAATVFQWYQSLLAHDNWIIDKDAPKVPASRQNKMFLLKAKKGHVDLSITCVKPDRAPFAVINITAFTLNK